MDRLATRRAPGADFPAPPPKSEPSYVARSDQQPGRKGAKMIAGHFPPSVSFSLQEALAKVGREQNRRVTCTGRCRGRAAPVLRKARTSHPRTSSRLTKPIGSASGVVYLFASRLVGKPIMHGFRIVRCRERQSTEACGAADENRRLGTEAAEHEAGAGVAQRDPWRRAQNRT